MYHLVHRGSCLLRRNLSIPPSESPSSYTKRATCGEAFSQPGVQQRPRTLWRCSLVWRALACQRRSLLRRQTASHTWLCAAWLNYSNSLQHQSQGRFHLQGHADAACSVNNGICWPHIACSPPGMMQPVSTHPRTPGKPLTRYSSRVHTDQ